MRVEHPDYPLDISDDEIAALYRDLVLVRRFDTEATALQRQGELGLWASLLGQEAAQVGAGRALRQQDMAFPTYREHGVAWCRGVDPLTLLGLFRGTNLGGWDPTRAQLQPVHDRHRRADAARGRLRDGRAARRRGRHRRPRPRHRRAGLLRRRRVQPGRRQRGVRLGRRPATCRSSSSARTTSGRSPSRSSDAEPGPAVPARAAGFGFPGVRVDGNDVLACLAVTRKALDDARSGQGPTLIEAFTYRMGAHTTSDDPTRYRLAAELETWKLQGPDRAGPGVPDPQRRLRRRTSSPTSRPSRETLAEHVRSRLPRPARPRPAVAVRPRLRRDAPTSWPSSAPQFADYLESFA